MTVRNVENKLALAAALVTLAGVYFAAQDAFAEDLQLASLSKPALQTIVNEQPQAVLTDVAAEHADAAAAAAANVAKEIKRDLDLRLVNRT